jgi:alpha-L-rhamnosidase
MLSKLALLMSLSVTDLRCETLTNPMGVGSPKPSLSWRIESSDQDVRQTAFQIVAATSREKALKGTGDLWDSGKVASNQSVWVVFDGKAPKPKERVWWRVKVWSGSKESDWSELGYWESALKSSDWKARWIGGAISGGPRSYAPAAFMRTSFKVSKAVASARLYISALGIYEPWLNGKRVGDHEFAPGWTDFSKRVRYQTYDVTPQIHQGSNDLGGILGDGWYCGSLGWRGRQLYGDRPKLLAQLELAYADGSTEVIASDKSWRHTYGPILEGDLLMGESYDARKELGNWSGAGYKDASWQPSLEFKEDVAVVPEENKPMRVVETLKPISIKEVPQWPQSKWIFDLGQNMVGRIRLKVKGAPGQTITLRYAEVLDKDGQIYTANLRSAKQTDHYTMKGIGTEIWEPKFTFHGFRYVEVGGVEGTPTKDMVTGQVIHSDLENRGSFESSDKLLNQLQHNIFWGWRGNSLDVPTDCPQRDERLGWTGDAQVFAQTACFNQDAFLFWNKFVQDLEDSQKEDGAVPAIAPDIHVVGPEGGPAWADAFLMVPWTLYNWYGDSRLIERHYDSFARYFAFLDSTSKDNLRCYDDYKGFKGFGDWLSIEAPTSHELIGTAFFAHAADLMSKFAEITGRPADAKKYAKRFEEIKKSFQNRYVTKDGLIVNSTQTSYLLGLHFNLLADNHRAIAIKEIVGDVAKRNGHLSTGFVGASYLNPELTLGGRTDIAYQLMAQTSWPSWLYSVTKGATTIWERWDGWTEEKGFQDPGMNSFNHYAYGAIGAWMYDTILGIQSVEPGFSKFRLAAKPGGKLTWAKGHLDTAYGPIESSWKVDGSKFTWDIAVPPNTTATVVTPDGKSKEYGSGKYRLECTISPLN